MGLHDILHAIVMRISSVKTVLWLEVNLHHLLSDGAAFTTQSRRSLTSYAISRALSHAIHLRFLSVNCLACQWTISDKRTQSGTNPSYLFGLQTVNLFGPEPPAALDHATPLCKALGDTVKKVVSITSLSNLVRSSNLRDILQMSKHPKKYILNM